MPKEITYSSGPEFVLEPDGSEVHPDKALPYRPGEPTPPVLRRAAIVGWSRDKGHVEIGLDAITVATEHGTFDKGMYASFDRAGLNRLIRSLRKARDQAFGADA